jgi:hypothetical protein
MKIKTIRITPKLIVVFDDGTEQELEIPEKTYYYQQQKRTYWVRWIENLMLEKNIKAKPIEVKEINVVEECEYDMNMNIIGL